MARKKMAYVIDCIDHEGFDYAFTGYSDYPEVEDEKFHELRLKYLEARQALADYIGVDPS